ncbi:hypothetical protein pb186bvf_019859 [Paramecium bursaria]
MQRYIYIFLFQKQNDKTIGLIIAFDNCIQTQQYENFYHKFKISQSIRTHEQLSSSLEIRLRENSRDKCIPPKKFISDMTNRSTEQFVELHPQGQEQQSTKAIQSAVEEALEVKQRREKNSVSTIFKNIDNDKGQVYCLQDAECCRINTLMFYNIQEFNQCLNRQNIVRYIKGTEGYEVGNVIEEKMVSNFRRQPGGFSGIIIKEFQQLDRFLTNYRQQNEMKSIFKGFNGLVEQLKDEDDKDHDSSNYLLRILDYEKTKNAAIDFYVPQLLINKMQILNYRDCSTNQIDDLACEDEDAVAYRLGLFKDKKTFKRLEHIVDMSLQMKSKQILVGFGQQVCMSNKREKCGTCLLKNMCEFFSYKQQLLIKDKTQINYNLNWMIFFWTNQPFSQSSTKSKDVKDSKSKRESQRKKQNEHQYIIDKIEIHLKNLLQNKN